MADGLKRWRYGVGAGDGEGAHGLPVGYGMIPLVCFPEPRVGTNRERVMRVILEMQAQR
jgi:hypothetical protein